ncbi:MAG TPA: hypothetical protein VFX21_09610 [Acidimicrobiia bacterium]|nr:hypothetical protein [Acidimicrobiia bacterium]
MIVAAVDPDQARADAEAILGGRRYHSDPAPRPFRGQLKWIGDRLQSVGDAIGKVFDLLPWWVWLLIAITAVALFVWYLVRNAERRRVLRVAAGTAPSATVATDDPDALERDADDAERNGDYERAVRLRFRAGLLRLGTRGRIEYTSSITNGEVRRTLQSPTFDDLASTFDEITYGEREAVPPDASDARTRWPELTRGGRR